MKNIFNRFHRNRIIKDLKGLKDMETTIRCNHNYKDKDTSIVLSQKRTMAYPDTRRGFCPYCQQTFMIDFNENNKENSKDS